MPQFLIQKISEVTEGNAIVSVDVGQHQMWTAQYYQFNHPRSWLSSSGLGTMGYGFPAAMGAAMGCPDRTVVCITGDGAFQMHYQELPTAVQHGAPVTWVVLDNRSLGWIKFGQRRLGDRYISTDYEAQPDFARLAQACGCYGENVEQPENVRGALERALEANREGKPAVIAFSVDGWDFAEGFYTYYGLKKE